VKVIADSSFFIALATVDTLSLLPQMCPEVHVPDAVYGRDRHAWHWSSRG
jgi:hypothetical protein